MPQQTLLPENDIVQVHGLTFFVYPLLSHPLMREEAYKCLGHLLDSVADAIDELHKKLEVVHLDICLENICFKESNGEFSAILIDLDRCAPVSKCGDFIMYSKSCMYQKPAGERFTNEKFNWM